MNDFLTELYYTLTGDISTPKGDPEYEKALQVFEELEKQMEEKVGTELLAQYQRAHHDAFHWEDVATFTCGLRFGARLVLEVLN